MKRKIAAIMAADVAGYSRLVADDEEEALRRLAAYREVVDDFIAKSSGRIFSTAGDAVLAEFSSAVEAVRCAIDIQESLRTRNLAYPPSRQMSFRIGITIGDVVERGGDLLGDGVNIAARLESIAPVGGICVSRNVFEQVSNKLSVQFADIGEQQVKNIPNPVHAFTVALSVAEGDSPFRKERKKQTSTPMVLALAGLAAAAVAAVAYFLLVPAAKPPAVATAPVVLQPPAVSPPVTPPALPPRAAAVIPAPALREPAKLVAEVVPMISDRDRASIRNNYLPAPGSKALAISPRRAGFLTGQPDEESAKAGALSSCQRATDAIAGPRFECELFAIGDILVSPRTHPPLPPEPWLVSNPAVERPFAAADVPLIPNNARTGIAQRYVPAPVHKALALAPSGQIGFYINQASVTEAARRALEYCGLMGGIPCTIIAIDNVFAVAVPATMKPVGLFQPAGDPAIAAGEREEVARRLADNAGGWSVVAAGLRGRAGLALKAASESEAIANALADCGARDGECRVIAIGMFSVAAK
jgi:class 3 adenylate cyclase